MYVYEGRQKIKNAQKNDLSLLLYTTSLTLDLINPQSGQNHSGKNKCSKLIMYT